MAQHLGYRTLLRSMGPTFTTLGIVGRLPTSILPLALLLYAQSQLGSFALAGLATAALSLGGASGAVLIGHLSDTLGHRVVGVGTTLVQTVALIGFLLTCRPDAPLPFATPMTPERVLMSTHQGISPAEAGAPVPRNAAATIELALGSGQD